MQGPAGPQGAPGTTAAPSDYSFYYGTGYKASVGAVEVGGSFDRDQIDMSNATSVRLVVTIGPSSAERELCSSRVHARRNELVRALGRSTCDDAERALLEWLARPADRSERRLRGTHSGIKRWDCRSADWTPPAARTVHVGQDLLVRFRHAAEWTGESRSTKADWRNIAITLSDHPGGFECYGLISSVEAE